MDISAGSEFFFATAREIVVAVTTDPPIGATSSFRRVDGKRVWDRTRRRNCTRTRRTRGRDGEERCEIRCSRSQFLYVLDSLSCRGSLRTLRSVRFDFRRYNDKIHILDIFTGRNYLICRELLYPIPTLPFDKVNYDDALAGTEIGKKFEIYRIRRKSSGYISRCNTTSLPLRRSGERATWCHFLQVAIYSSVYTYLTDSE